MSAHSGTDSGSRAMLDEAMLLNQSLHISHACPERPVTQRKCPKTIKGIPIFVTAVQTREGVSQLFSLSAFRENTFFFSGSAPMPLHCARRHRRAASGFQELTQIQE